MRSWNLDCLPYEELLENKRINTNPDTDFAESWKVTQSGMLVLKTNTTRLTAFKF